VTTSKIIAIITVTFLRVRQLFFRIREEISQLKSAVSPHWILSCVSNRQRI